MDTLKSEIPPLYTQIQLIHGDIHEFNQQVEVIIQNPPFGTKVRHADRMFLEKAFTSAPIIYSIHKTVTEKFLVKCGEQHGFRITETARYHFPLRKSMKHHIKSKKEIDVIVVRFEKKEWEKK